jgi:rhodanese-related sulfurtransferase
MTKTIKEMLEEANTVVPVISPEDAFDLQKQGALIIDTREIEEVKKSGKVKGAHHVPRGLI